MYVNAWIFNGLLARKQRHELVSKSSFFDTGSNATCERKSNRGDVCFTGRFHEGYSESAGYGQYDATPFQTVPGSGSGAGSGVGDDQWGVGLADHLPHHPAFLASLGARDSSNPHHPTSIGNNADQKPLLQSPMLAGYAGEFDIQLILHVCNSSKKLSDS